MSKMKRKAGRIHLVSHEARAHRLEDAVEALLLAYAKNDGGMDSIDWDDVDAAFVLAKHALPGRYKALVRQIEKENA